MDNNMVITFSILITVMFSHVVDIGAAVESSLHPPAIGDVRLVPYSDPGGRLRGFYEVLVYYSDGIDKPDWGGICSEYSSKELGKVICQQLGYSPGEITEKNTDTSTPVWIKKAACNGSESHILRCNNTVVHGAERTNANTCNGKERLLLNCNFDGIKDPYNGEIRLCPPDNINNTLSSNKTSVSFGAVQMFLSDHGGGWRGINQNKSTSNAFLGSIEADAICRQMGYTGAIPGSAVTWNASGYMFQRCFSGNIHHNAWLTTDKDSIKCTVPQKCFGCCYTSPTVECQNCDTLHNIVIGCAFDINEAGHSEGGTFNDCIIHSTTPHCDEAQVQKAEKCKNYIWGPLAAILIVSILALIIISVVIIVYCGRTKGYFRLRGNDNN